MKKRVLSILLAICLLMGLLPAAALAANEHSHCACGGSVNAGSHTSHSNVTYKPWDGTSAISYSSKKAYVYLTDNATLQSNLEITGGKTLYLCLNGKTLASNGTTKIVVKDNSKLILCDCAGGGTIQAATSGWGGMGVYLYKSTMDMYGGRITGGNATRGGGAIALDDKDCVFNMYGGELSNNKSASYGGAILINGVLYDDATNSRIYGGTVNIYGGAIKNNTASLGGALYAICGGTVNIKGGTFSDNQAGSGGGAIAMNYDGKVTMSGGSFTGNRANGTDGGALNLYNSTFTFSGGDFSGNYAKETGGAIYLSYYSKATMSGGTIRNNTAGQNGGAVCLAAENTRFVLSAGTISGNKAVNGGAFYLDGCKYFGDQDSSSLRVHGGEISGNTATGNGGAVYLLRQHSILSLYSGTIKNNTADGNGGAVYFHTPSGGTPQGGVVVTGNPVVKGNTVSGKANNIYLPTGKVVAIGGDMSSGASIGVSTESKDYPVVIAAAVASSITSDYTSYFFDDDAIASVRLNSNNLELVHTHSLTYVPAKAAGCTTPGNKAYYICSGCKRMFEDADGKTEITDPNSIILDPINHSWNSATYQWSEDGKSCTAKRVCKNDATHVETATATVTGVVTKPATCLGAGQTTYTATFAEDWATTQTKAIYNIPATKHSWNAPTYQWSEDGKACTAKRVCKNDATHVETATATVTSEVTKPATCTEAGETTYTATFAEDWATTQTKTIADIGATNHSWNETTYKWSEDGKSCTAERVCKNDATHVETATATVTSEVTKPATCTEAGETTYTATFTEDWATTQTKTIADIGATDHSWNETTYKWSEDGKSCTAERVCKNDATHVETATATVTSEVTKPATCTEAGETTYTATFAEDWATTQTKTIADIGATDHSWNETTYKWSKDGTSCTAERICKNDADHVETATATVTSEVTKPATCTEAGETTYTATFAEEWATTQTKVLADIGATNHLWNAATYEWSEDGKTCTAERVCKNDATHVETATATVTSEVTKPATCTEAGETTYTATFTEDWATTQTKTVADIGATDHSWNEPTYEWSEDGKTCTAERVCKNDADHIETATATVTSEVTKPATCTEAGETTYTATFTEDWATTQTKTIADIAPIEVPELNKGDHVAYIVGYADGTVQPMRLITRAEVTTIFFRLLTDESRAAYWSQTNPYPDVTDAGWYNNAVSTMTSAGIVGGYPDGSFRPDQPITRAEFVAIAVRFSEATYEGGNSFTDVPENHWAAQYIALAEHLGWINGYSDGSFRPDQPITRAEAMAFINRMLERAVEEEHMLPDMITWPDNTPDAWYYEDVQEATNSHSYTRTDKCVPEQDFDYEDWLEILPIPNWGSLEKAWPAKYGK